MLKKFLQHGIEMWAGIALLDTQDKCDQDGGEQVPVRSSSSLDILQNIHKKNSIPRLKFPFAVYNEKDCREFLVEQIKRDIIEQGKKPVDSIKWGSDHCRPSFWPEKLAPWSEFSNPAHKQNKLFKTSSGETVKVVTILRAAVRRRMKQRGLDVDTYHLPKYNEDQVRKREIKWRKTNLRNNLSILSDSDIIAESSSEISRLSLNLSQMSVEGVREAGHDVAEDRPDGEHGHAAEDGQEDGHAAEDGHGGVAEILHAGGEVAVTGTGEPIATIVLPVPEGFMEGLVLEDPEVPEDEDEEPMEDPLIPDESFR